MQLLATLDSESAARLVEHLAGFKIPSVVRQCIEEGGIPGAELLVEDSLYESACEVAETWQAAEADARARKARRICPQCRSPHLDFIEQASFGSVYRCCDCGSSVVRR